MVSVPARSARLALRRFFIFDATAVVWLTLGVHLAGSSSVMSVAQLSFLLEHGQVRGLRTLAALHRQLAKVATVAAKNPAPIDAIVVNARVFTRAAAR